MREVLVALVLVIFTCPASASYGWWDSESGDEPWEFDNMEQAIAAAEPVPASSDEEDSSRIKTPEEAFAQEVKTILALPEDTTEYSVCAEEDLDVLLPSLPQELTRLTKLEDLRAAYLLLTPFPEVLLQLTTLQKLDLDGNAFTFLPSAITQLHNLQELSLGQNKLAELPSELCSLSRLTQLCFEKNRLTTLPANFSALTNLTLLNVRGNLLPCLPEAIAQLPLESLYIDKNPFTSEAWNTPLPLTLTTLKAEDTGLNQIPTSVLLLTRLTELDLRNNEIIEIPRGISVLTGLVTLQLQGNKIVSLPKELNYLTKLSGLALDDNPLERLPEYVVQQLKAGSKTALTEYDPNGTLPSYVKETEMTLAIRKVLMTKLGLHNYYSRGY